MKKEELLARFDTLNDEEKKALISSFFDRNEVLESALIDKENALRNKEKIILDKDNIIIDKENIIKENKILITEQKTLIFYYEELLKLRNKEKFAKKSESALGPLFDEFELDKSMQEIEEKIENQEEITVSSYKRKKKPNLVNEDNKNIPIERIDITSDDKNLVDINSDEITKRLVVIPRQFKILEIHLHQYKKILDDGSSKIIRPNNPYINPLGKTMVSTSLVSMIITNKIINALPLYRQEQDFKREGINLARQDMSNYVYQANDIVSSVVDKIKEYVINSEITRSDETPLNIINKDGKKLEGNTNSYVWVLSSGRGYYPSSLYTLGPGRGKQLLLNLFDNKKRFLQSDRYDAYKNLLNVTNVYCLAHIRRKFYALIDKKTKDDAPSKIIVSKIDEIYHIDNIINNQYKDNYEKIKEERIKLLLPKCNELFSYIQEQYDKCLTKSSIGRALSYALNCKEGFMNVFKDGRLELDNNASERKVKMFVIGRKNWLFANTIKGAEVSCNLYSLLRTAVENNLKPFEYLTYLLDTLGPLNEKDRLSLSNNLLPWSNNIPDYIKLKDYNI